MEIKNYTNAVNAYRFAADNKVRSVKKQNSAKNTDKAEFSAAAKANHAVSFADSLKASAKAAADTSASSARLNELSKAISDGSYSVSAEDVASAILGF